MLVPEQQAEPQAQPEPTPEQLFKGVFSDPDNQPEPDPAPNTTPEPTLGSTPEPAPQVQDKLGKTWAELTKKGRELLAKEQELKQLEQEATKFKSLQETAKADPYKVLSDLGISFDSLIDQYISQGAQPKQEPVKVLPEVEALKTELEKTKQEIAQFRFSQFQQSEHNKIKHIISDMADECEIVADSMANGDQVVDQLLQAGVQEYKETGNFPDYRDLVKRAESILEKDYLSALERVKKLKKVQGWLSGVQPKKQEPEPKQQTVKAKPLSNAMAAIEPTEANRPLTQEEREREFLEIIRKGSTDTDS